MPFMDPAMSLSEETRDWARKLKGIWESHGLSVSDPMEKPGQGRICMTISNIEREQPLLLPVVFTETHTWPTERHTDEDPHGKMIMLELDKESPLHDVALSLLRDSNLKDEFFGSAMVWEHGQGREYDSSKDAIEYVEKIIMPEKEFS